MPIFITLIYKCLLIFNHENSVIQKHPAGFTIEKYELDILLNNRILVC